MCASCHAIATSGASPHPAAPPFRIIGRRIDIDDLYDKLREGLSSGHRDMPTFRFTREDARAVRVYLRTIASEGISTPAAARIREASSGLADPDDGCAGHLEQLLTKGPE